MDYNFEKLVARMEEADKKFRTEQCSQACLGDLITMLEELSDEDVSKRIFFDDTEFYPTGADSWRGTYSELAFTYGESYTTRFAGDDSWTYDQAIVLEDEPTAKQFLEFLHKIDGVYMQGYKGGDYCMDSGTPLWVANYSEVACMFCKNNPEGYYTGVIGIEIQDDRINILTETKDW